MYSSLDYSLGVVRREETRREVGRSRLAERLRTGSEDRAVRGYFRFLRGLGRAEREVEPESA